MRRLFELALLLAAAAVALASAHSSEEKVVRITEFEKGTLFGLERVTYDDLAIEDLSDVCGDLLVYDTNKDGNWEIYIKKVTGKAVTRKTNSNSSDRAPSLSGDCTRIAFVSDREGEANIYAISADRASAALKVGPGDQPNFSKDGNILVYQRYMPREAATSIWMYNFDTNQHSQLVAGFHPTMSPDGKFLAYSRVNNVTGRASIWLIDLDTQMEQEVISHPDYACVLPLWSPDGQQILVTLNKGRVGMATFPEGAPNFEAAQLAVGSVNGGNLTILTDNPANDIGRSWGDDGFIYFSSTREQSMDIWRFQPRLFQ